MGSFNNIGLKKEIIKVLTRLKYKKSFEVQEKVIPLAVQRKNVVFTSRTGSGKTLAYSLAFIGQINKKLNLQMVVLVPTRELCIQVGKELKKICEPLGLNVGMLYGGREIVGDYKTTNKKNHIIVGTPGRLIQHVNNKQIKLGEVKLLVFDESDQMFDNGFSEECEYVASRASKNAQMILASATMTSKVENFVKDVIVDYELLNIGRQIPKNILQEKLFVEKEEKNASLLNILSKNKPKKVIIFCNTKIKCEDVSEFLKDKGFNAKSLSGDLDQTERSNRLNLFKAGKIFALVASDVAARGLHIENVDLIINFDVPSRTEFYVHRIGRSGRKDKKGHAITLICSEDKERFENIEIEFGLETTSVNI